MPKTKKFNVKKRICWVCHYLLWATEPSLPYVSGSCLIKWPSHLQASFAKGNPTQAEAVRRRKEQREMAYLLENFGCPARVWSWISALRGSLWFYVRPFELICTVSLRDRFLQCHHHQIRETAWPLSLSSEAEKTSGKERDGAKEDPSCSMSPAKLGSQEQKGKDGSQARREGNVWTGLLAMLLSAVRENIQNGRRGDTATKLSRSTVLCLHANSGGESNSSCQALTWMLSVFNVPEFQYPSPWWYGRI